MPDAPPPDERPGEPDAAGHDAPASKQEGHVGGFTLDLSSRPSTGQPEAWRRKRKQASPILTKIVDLTAPKPEPEPPKPSEQQAPQAKRQPKPPREKEREAGRGRGKKPGGATLADLLDEETLARLRGEE